MDLNTVPSQNLFTLLITWGTVQSFVVAGIVLFRREHRLGQRVALSCLITLLGLQSGNFLYENFRWYLDWPHGIFAAGPLWFLIGPALYFFQRYASLESARFRWFDAAHTLPFIGALVYISPFYWLQSQTKLNVLQSFYINYNQTPDFFFYAVILTQLAYGFHAFWRFRHYFKLIGNSHSDPGVYRMRWVVPVIGGYICFWLITAFYHLLLMLNFQVFIRFDYFTYLSLIAFGQSLGMAALLFPDLFFAQPLSSKDDRETEVRTTPDKTSPDQELTEAFAQLEHFMNRERPYLSPSLRIRDLGTMMNIAPHRLSHIVNRCTGKNFFEFINAYRVEEIKRRMPDPKYRHLTLEAIARECGFNSNASFYRVFKQYTGLTPKAFLKLYEAESKAA